MSSLNFLYKTPLFPTLGVLILLWAPWIWALKYGNQRDEEMRTPWMWLNIFVTIMLIYFVLTDEN